MGKNSKKSRELGFERLLTEHARNNMTRLHAAGIQQLRERADAEELPRLETYRLFNDYTNFYRTGKSNPAAESSKRTWAREQFLADYNADPDSFKRAKPAGMLYGWFKQAVRDDQNV